MRARHWTMTAIGGLAGFAAVALCIVYAMLAGRAMVRPWLGSAGRSRWSTTPARW